MDLEGIAEWTERSAGLKPIVHSGLVSVNILLFSKLSYQYHH